MRKLSTDVQSILSVPLKLFEIRNDHFEIEQDCFGFFFSLYVCLHECQDRGGVQFDLTMKELCQDCAQVQKSKQTTLWKREMMAFRF